MGCSSCQSESLCRMLLLVLMKWLFQTLASEPCNAHARACLVNQLLYNVIQIIKSAAVYRSGHILASSYSCLISSTCKSIHCTLGIWSIIIIITIIYLSQKVCACACLGTMGSATSNLSFFPGPDPTPSAWRCSNPYQMFGDSYSSQKT